MQVDYREGKGHGAVNKTSPQRFITFPYSLSQRERGHWTVNYTGTQSFTKRFLIKKNFTKLDWFVQTTSIQLY